MCEICKIVGAKDHPPGGYTVLKNGPVGPENLMLMVNKEIMRDPLFASTQLMQISLIEFATKIKNGDRDLGNTLLWTDIYKKYGDKFEICRDVMTPDELEVIQAILTFFVMFFGGKKKNEK